jgi:hypothetical protein
LQLVLRSPLIFNSRFFWIQTSASSAFLFLCMHTHSICVGASISDLHVDLAGFHLRTLVFNLSLSLGSFGTIYRRKSRESSILYFFCQFYLIGRANYITKMHNVFLPSDPMLRTWHQYSAVSPTHSAGNKYLSHCHAQTSRQGP